LGSNSSIAKTKRVQKEHAKFKIGKKKKNEIRESHLYSGAA
jgi:hypothetical protein